mmetsp:Transcript_12595/g.13838  ORF Transcript_12595/g.13838 Transcript_12595/m.13838 type:complete len:454 (-) Transcript_12595:53-1414(-)
MVTDLTPDDISSPKGGWKVISGGILLHLVLGCIYLWGGITVYVTSYLRLYNPDVTFSTTFIVFPLAWLMQNIGFIIYPWIVKRTGVKGCLLLTILLVSGGTFASSFLTDVYAFIVVYGVLVSLAYGTGYLVPIKICWEYFPMKKGMVTGLIVAGFGTGAFLFNFIATAVVNPHGEGPEERVTRGSSTEFYFGESVASRVPLMLRVMSACYLVLCSIAFPLIKSHQIQAALEVNEDAEDPKSVPLLRTQTNQESEYSTLSDCLATGNFWRLFVMGFMSLMFTTFMANSYKTFGQSFISSDYFLTLVGAFGALSNGLSRSIWGELSDLFGFKLCYTALLCLEAVVIFLISLSSKIESKTLYLILVILVYCCHGGNASMFPSECGRLFGSEMGVKAFGVVFFGFTFAALTTVPVNSYLLPVVGYTGIFSICLTLVSFALIIVVTYRPVHTFSVKNI